MTFVEVLFIGPDLAQELVCTEADATVLLAGPRGE